MTENFDPMLVAELTGFFDEKTKDFRTRPKGLDVLQLKEGYLDYGCSEAEIGSVYWVAHPVEVEDFELFWVQIFEVQGPGTTQGKAKVTTEQRILSKEQVLQLLASSSLSSLALEHSGVKKAFLTAHKTSIESLRGGVGFQSAVEFNKSVNNWHILWPLHRIALCRDDGNITVFLPSPLDWSRWCLKVGVFCGLDQDPLIQFVRGATKDYLSALRYVHTSRFLERDWLKTIKNLIRSQPVSLADFSETLAYFDGQAELLHKKELRKPATERMGWDVFTSLPQYGNLLCTVPDGADLSQVPYIQLTPNEAGSPFIMLPELVLSENSERVLTHTQALNMERNWEPPASIESGIPESALNQLAQEIALVSGQDAPLVKQSLYFDRVRLSAVLDAEFEATAHYFQ